MTDEPTHESTSAVPAAGTAWTPPPEQPAAATAPRPAPAPEMTPSEQQAAQEPGQDLQGLPPAAPPSAPTPSPSEQLLAGLTGESTQKVRTILGRALDALAKEHPALAAFAAPALARLPIPEDPAELDRLLVENAKISLALRSDGAAAIKLLEEVT